MLSLIIYGFKNNPKIDHQYFESLNKSLTYMITHCNCNPSLVGFILDTAYCYPTQIKLDPNRVTEGKFIIYLLKLTYCNISFILYTYCTY